MTNIKITNSLKHIIKIGFMREYAINYYNFIFAYLKFGYISTFTRENL